jgi:hypothetical protein
MPAFAPSRLLLTAILITFVPAAGAAGPSEAVKPAPVLQTVAGGYLKVGFDVLAGYPFETPPPFDPAADPKAASPAVDGQLPGYIRQLDGQKVLVTGFMLPIKMEGGLVKEFLLLKNQMMCCYGVPPQMNEWVLVRMTGDDVKPVMDTPVSFYGRLKVGAMFESGYMTGLYLLEGEKLAAEPAP